MSQSNTTIASATKDAHEFISYACSRDRLASLRCCIFSLFHSGVDDKERAQVCVDGIAESIDALDALTDDARIRAIERMVERFTRQAYNVTNEAARPQRFVIVGYNSVDPDAAHIDQTTFSLDPSPEAVAKTGTEPTTEKGALALSFRHLEIQSKHAIDSAKEVRAEREANNARFERILAMTMQRNAVLEQNMLTMTEKLQDALDRQSTRQVEAYERKVAIDREERMWQAVEALAPMVLDKFGFGPAANLFRSFSAEEIKAFAAMCPPSRKALLYEVLDKYLGLKLLERPQSPETPALANGAAHTEESDNDTH